MMGASSESTSMEYVPSAPESSKVPIAPMETHVLLVFTGRRCLCLFRHRHNDVLLDHWQHSFWIGACSCSKLPIAPMGKLLTRLPRLTLAQLRTLRSTTECTCRRDLESSHGPHGRLMFCSFFQGGGVYVYSGTVTMTSCSITGNTAAGAVREHVHNFPLPRWENC